MKKNRYNLTRRTALVMHRLLKDGTQYTASEIRERIDGEDGASARYISPGAKWLRDHGIPVATVRKRHLSVWLTPETAQQMDEYGIRIVQDSYSEIRSNIRSCKTLTGPGSRIVRQKLMKCAIELGEYLDMDVEEVREDCQPLHVVAGNGAVSLN